MSECDWWAQKGEGRVLGTLSASWVWDRLPRGDTWGQRGKKSKWHLWPRELHEQSQGEGPGAEPGVGPARGEGGAQGVRAW